MKKFEDLEEKLMVINSLLEVTKTYCEHKCENSEEISVLAVILDFISMKQKELINEFDNTSLAIAQT